MGTRNGVILTALVTAALAAGCGDPHPAKTVRYDEKSRPKLEENLTPTQYAERQGKTLNDYNIQTVRTKFKWVRHPLYPAPHCANNLDAPKGTEAIVDYWYTYDGGTPFSGGEFHECGGIALIPK